ncbi:MAG TPA: PAS domain S-box protein [Ktedonobacterales bacterium]|nr:PAS domain S-box protein [Ktedonobacterales bacterium]
MLNNMKATNPMPQPPGVPSFSVGLSISNADPLTQSAARFRALAQATGQIYWITDAQGLLIDATSWCAFTGQTSDEASGDGWTAALHPDDREPTLADWKAAIVAGHPYRHEHRVRRADGQYCSMLVQAYPVLDAEGMAREWVGVDTDITLLGELRADVQASQEEFQATFEQAAVGIAHIQLDNGRFLRANQKLCEILGYAHEELLCHTFQELTYSPDLDTNLTLLEQLLAGEISTYTLEKRYIRKDGSVVWANLTTSLKRDRAGTPEYGIAVIEDISARKAAEEALRQSEQQYRQLFEMMAQGVIYYSASGEILSANPAALRILGLSQEEIRGRTAFDPGGQSIYEDGSPHTTETLPAARALRTGQPISDVVGCFNVKEQAYRWLQVAAIPEFRPGESAPHQLFATFEDITERRQLEEALSARVQELETVFASMSEGLIVIGADGQILRANPAYEALVGWPTASDYYRMSKEERYRVLQIRNGQGQIIPPDQMPIAQVFQGEQVAMEQTFRSGDGREVYASMRGAPLTDTAGHITGAVLVFHDITERRQLEQQTREALSALLHMAELLVQQPDESDEQRSALLGQHLAELACSLLGCPVAIILTFDPKTLGMQVLAAVGHSPNQEGQLHAIITSWSHTAPDLVHLSRLMAGETLVVDVTEPPYQEVATLFEIQQAIVAPMLLGGHLIGMVVFNPGKLAQKFTDQQIALAGATAQLVGLVIERERLLHEREEARARALALHESQQQMDTFLGMVGHELKTPLATMKLAIQLIHRRLERATLESLEAASNAASLLPTLQELFAPVERQNARLERLVKDLLDASRSKEGKLELKLERANLSAIVQEVVAEQRALLPQRVIQLHTPTEAGGAAPMSPSAGMGPQALVVLVDSDFIKQAVINYLTNALKYSPETTPVLVGVEQQAEQALVWVRDQGPGIAPADQEHVWDRFYRVPGIREQKESVGGLGLGLYVTRMLIERHQGQVGMTSTPGQGATFWFTLPLAE